MEEKVELSGRNAFEILLDIICDFDILFMKQNYLNTSDFSYFFSSEKIEKKREILDTLSRKSSLKTAYNTLGSILDMRLSFYIGIKDNILSYGYYNENNKYIYKVGRFKVSSNDLKILSKHKCLKTIRSILENNNIKNLNLLHVIKQEFNIFKDVESDIEILDENRIKNTYPISILKEEDRDENKLRIFLIQYSRNYKWSDKCYYIIVLTEKYVHFYIKIKPVIQD